MSEKSDKLRAMLEKEKERRIKLNNRIEILERRIHPYNAQLPLFIAHSEKIFYLSPQICKTAGPQTRSRRPYLPDQKYFCTPSLASSRSALMVTVNLILFFSEKALSQSRNSSSVWSVTSALTIFVRLSMNTWVIS